MESNIQRLDVTLRDGGFINGFCLSPSDVFSVVRSLGQSIAHMVELGYVGGLPADHGCFSDSGPVYDLPASLVHQLVEATTLPCAVMMHPECPNSVDVSALSKTGVSLVRVPFRPSFFRPAIRILNRLRDVGLRTSANFILGSWWPAADIEAAARAVEKSDVTMIYLADTTSGLNPTDVAQIFSLLRQVVSVPLGFHAHDGRGLALANTFAAIDHGAKWIDASVFGIGRDAGNAPMEVLATLEEGNTRTLERQLLASLPILRAFELTDSEMVWLRVCALLDLSPPCARLLENTARMHKLHRVEAAIRLAGSKRIRPLTQKICEGLLSTEKMVCSPARL